MLAAIGTTITVYDKYFKRNTKRRVSSEIKIDSKNDIDSYRQKSPVENSEGQCDAPHVQNCYRVAPGALSSEFRHESKFSDMNIIEYIWDALQHAVQKRSPTPLTPIELGTTLQDSGVNYLQHYFRH
ncbi:hypothetical protein TNCT_549221 [Trichonephila clavata]|uniref:Uncharacterized protein n=1 Tax=Trichonephila clavata TaxID=2740835 RepID=A0A8X6F4P5_TRICU|nr:hypothetical protein TNCT_549221 [Trichonephila clavata]